MAALFPVLDWSNARVVIFLINALFGLQHYYEKHASELEINEVFALRIIQGCASYLMTKTSERGDNTRFFIELQSLHSRANKTAFEGLFALKHHKRSEYEKCRSFLWHPYKILYESLKFDSTSTLNFTWFVDSFIGNATSWTLSDLCFTEFASSFDTTCHLSEKCLERISLYGPREHFRYQLLYVALSLQGSCKSVVEKYLATENETYNGFISKRCAKLLEGHRDRVINRKTSLFRFQRAVTDMMEVFACGQYGIIDGNSLYLVLSFLRLQHPIFGCFPTKGFTRAFGVGFTNNNGTDQCSAHWAFAGAIAVSLMFSAWRSFPSNSDTFELFVGDSSYSIGRPGKPGLADTFMNSSLIELRFVDPPELHRSSDFFAFLFFCAILLLVSLILHYRCSKKQKPFYHFAYKNL